MNRSKVRWSGPVGVLVAVALCAGCGFSSHRGVELGSLRESARRIEGGGVECPLAIDATLLRPATVPADAPVLPYRTNGDSSHASIGSGLPTPDSVKIACAYAIGGLRVELAVIGVTKGHAAAAFVGMFTHLAGKPDALAFIDANAQAPIDDPRTVPGKNPGAFVRVEAANGDVGLVIVVSRVDTGTKLPSTRQVADQARRIAHALAD